MQLEAGSEQQCPVEAEYIHCSCHSPGAVLQLQGGGDPQGGGASAGGGFSCAVLDITPKLKWVFSHMLY